MNREAKKKQGDEIKRIMLEKDVKVQELARALKVTAQTIYNVQRGTASDQLLDHTLLILDTWTN